MKKRVSTILVILLLGCFLFYHGTTCFGTEPTPTPDPRMEHSNSIDDYLGYQPIDPLPVEKDYWAAQDPEVIRRNLPLQSAQVCVQKNNSFGGIVYLSGSISLEKGTYTVIMDYMKYRIEDVMDDSNNYVGNGRIGVGLRIKAVVTTNARNLNLGSLFAIGLEAKNNRLHGSISVDVIGIDSQDVTNLIPLTSEIDQTSIQNALQALASIKTKIYDKQTILTPHLLAITINKPLIGSSQKIKDKITERGKSAVKLYKAQEMAILFSISPFDQHKSTKWQTLVHGAALLEYEKTRLLSLDSFEKIREFLDVDAGMSGSIISALYNNLKL